MKDEFSNDIDLCMVLLRGERLAFRLRTLLLSLVSSARRCRICVHVAFWLMFMLFGCLDVRKLSAVMMKVVAWVRSIAQLNSTRFVMGRIWPLPGSCERHLGDANDADDATGLGWWRERSRKMDFFFPLVSAELLFRLRKLKRGDRGIPVLNDGLCLVSCADCLFGVVAPSLCGANRWSSSDVTIAASHPALLISGS